MIGFWPGLLELGRATDFTRVPVEVYSSGSPIFLDEYTSTGTLVQSVEVYSSRKIGLPVLTSPPVPEPTRYTTTLPLVNGAAATPCALASSSTHTIAPSARKR